MVVVMISNVLVIDNINSSIYGEYRVLFLGLSLIAYRSGDPG